MEFQREGEKASVWDMSMNNSTGGKWFSVRSLTQFDADEEPNEDNYYSIVIDTEDYWD